MKTKFGLIRGILALFTLSLAACSSGGDGGSSTDTGSNTTTPQIVDGIDGTATVLASAPSDSTIIYAGFSGGISKSSDGGASWVYTGLNLCDVQAVAVDPADPTRVIAGGNGFPASLWESIDGGQSWSAISVDVVDVSDILFDPTDGNIVYVASKYGNNSSWGVYRTTDGDLSQLTRVYSAAAVWSLAVDPAGGGVVYAGTQTAGMQKSVDSGATWAAINTSLTATFIRDIAIDPNDNNTLWVGTNGSHLFKSTDAGANWTQVLLSDGSTPYVVEMDNGSNIYASSQARGIYKSTDGASTWQDINSLPLPQGSASPSSILVDSSDNSRLLTAWGRGLYETIDAGSTWSLSNSGLTHYGSPGLTAGPGGVYSFVVDHGIYKAGASWSLLYDYPSIYTGLIADPQNGDIIHFSDTGGYRKSIDGGTTFTQKFIASGVYPTVLGLDPVNPDILFADSTGDFIYKSTDGGETWFALTNNLPTGAYSTPNIQHFAFDPVSSGTVHAAIHTHGIVKTVDGGTTWTTIETSTNNNPIVYVDPTNADTLYAGSAHNGLIKSTDGGATWVPINTGLPTSLVNFDPHVFLVDPANAQLVFVGGSKGLYRSTDGGSSWTKMSIEFHSESIYGLALDPDDPSILYVGTSSGIWKTSKNF